MLPEYLRGLELPGTTRTTQHEETIKSMKPLQNDHLSAFFRVPRRCVDQTWPEIVAWLILAAKNYQLNKTTCPCFCLL